MKTYDMLHKLIMVKKSRGALTPEFVQDTKNKMDVFLMNNRISDTEYQELIKELEQ